ncbi:MAG: DUF3137 domain-containing protein [Cyclobacteriaceae bacterium]|jgi:hypothetical protein|nr:DUF3137 domain-containing protein [Flammeovirgaceae bacterium]
MKTTESFQSFYQTTLTSIVNALDVERKEMVKKIYMAGAAAVIFVILYGMINKSTVRETQLGPNGPTQYTYTGGYSGAIFYIAIAGVLGYFFWYRPRAKKFRSRFKNEIIRRIIKHADEKLEYHPEAGISVTDFIQSTIFDTAGDRYLCEDLVSGKIGSTTIRFSDVQTQRKKELKGDDGAPDFKRWVTLFKGIIFVADFNKHFKGRTMVLTDQAEKSLGGLGTFFQKMNAQRDPLVKMENTDFEKAFVVYASDAVEAHYILTPALMERMLNLRSRLGNVQFAFYNSVVFIAIPTKNDLFEANIFRPLTVQSEMEKYFVQLQFFTGIVEDLNLNNRIWTKE